MLPNLDLLTTGVVPPNPSELLVSATFVELLGTVSAQYDLVIIDTPPVLVATDTASVVPHAGTLLLVARAEQTQLGDLNECVKRLAHAGTSVKGVLLNALDLNRRHAGSHAYRYGSFRYRSYSYSAE